MRADLEDAVVTAPRASLCMARASLYMYMLDESHLKVVFFVTSQIYMSPLQFHKQWAKTQANSDKQKLPESNLTSSVTDKSP